VYFNLKAGRRACQLSNFLNAFACISTFRKEHRSSHFYVSSRSLENFSSRLVHAKMKPSFSSVRLAFISHKTPACLHTFNNIAACTPAIVASLSATFMPLRTLCSNFRHLFTIRYCHYIIVSFHFNALQIAPKGCVLPCTLGQMPGKVAFAPSPNMNHVCSSYSPHERHSSTRPYLLRVFSFRSDIVQRGRVPQPDCILLVGSVH